MVQTKWQEFFAVVCCRPLTRRRGMQFVKVGIETCMCMIHIGFQAFVVGIVSFEGILENLSAIPLFHHSHPSASGARKTLHLDSEVEYQCP